MKYLEFIQNLKEGLITTHDINKYSDLVTDYLDKNCISNKLEITDKFQFKLKIETNNFDLVEISNHTCYTLGYYPAYYWIILDNKMRNGFKEIDKLPSNTKYIIIQYESKYEDGLYTNDLICPDKLYHLSPQKNKKSILTKGIYPKSKRRISNHPERISLFGDIQFFETLLKSLKFTDTEKQEYLLLEINCINDKLFLHTDPNYRLGYFTYDNINPKNITILKENI